MKFLLLLPFLCLVGCDDAEKNARAAARLDAEDAAAQSRKADIERGRRSARVEMLEVDLKRTKLRNEEAISSIERRMETAAGGQLELLKRELASKEKEIADAEEAVRKAAE